MWNIVNLLLRMEIYLDLQLAKLTCHMDDLIDILLQILQHDYKCFRTGDASATITLEILPTNETRLMQEFIISLLAVEPSNVASLKSEFSTKRFVVPDVGNPGGVFSFSSDMNSTYTVRVRAHGSTVFLVVSSSMSHSILLLLLLLPFYNHYTGQWC